MRNYKIIAFFIFYFTITSLSGQDLQFTQFYSSPVYLNCAFTGANSCSRVSLVHRNQWQSISKPYKSYMATFDHFFYSKNLGIGLIVAQDESGSGAFKTNLIRPSFAYGTKLNKFNSIRFGLQPGIGIKSVNYNKLLFGDQIFRGGSSVATVETPALSKTYFDLSAGVLVSSEVYWAGFAVNHINYPNESLMGEEDSRVPPQLSFHAGIKIQLNKNEHDQRLKKFISPVIHYRKQNKFDQVDLGFYYTKHILNVGLWYRGIPLLKSYKKGYANNDAIALVAGIQAQRISIGYSYDLTISMLAGVSKGAHEISLSFQLCNPKNRKLKFPLIACPRF